MLGVGLMNWIGMVIIGRRYSKSTYGANESNLATTTKKIFTTNTVTTTMTKLITMMIEDDHLFQMMILLLAIVMMMVRVLLMMLMMRMLILVMLVTLFLATQLFQSASISALLGKEISPSINCDVIIIIPTLTKIKGTSNTKMKKCETLTIQRAQTSNMVYV